MNVTRCLGPLRPSPLAGRADESIPGRAAPPPQGLREPEMATIASRIARAPRERDTSESLVAVKAEVAELCAKVPPYPDGV